MFLFTKDPFCSKYDMRCLLVVLGYVLIPVEDLIRRSQEDFEFLFPHSTATKKDSA